MKPQILAIALLPLILASACATKIGPVNPPPKATSANPSKITIYRDPSFVGSPVTMVFYIDDTETYRLKQGQTYAFRLDPGSYVFGFYLGLNDCRKAVHFDKGKDYRVKLSASCAITPEKL